MRIGFMGAQGTGKTTLLREMFSWPEFNGYVFISGMTRATAKQNGTPLNQNGTYQGQKVLIKALSKRLKAEENLVVDRTLLDMFAYSCWGKQEGKISTRELMYLRNQIRVHQHYFDVVFYIRPEFPVKGDEIRSGDQSYAIAIAGEMERIVNHEPLGTKCIVALTGTVEQRLKQIKAIVEAKVKRQL